MNVGVRILAAVMKAANITGGEDLKKLRCLVKALAEDGMDVGVNYKSAYDFNDAVSDVFEYFECEMLKADKLLLKEKYYNLVQKHWEIIKEL